MYYKKRLNEIRTLNDISQKKLAQMLNISPYTYSHYETEDTIIPLKHLVTLCNYFNVSLDYIFNFNNIENYPNSKKELDLNLASTRLKEFRKENNLTQKELANKLNVARTIITEYEKAHYLISLHALYTICKTYHYSADYLLGFIDKPKYLK